MPHTIVDIPASQLDDEIDRFCRRLGISRTEAVRRALAAYLKGGVDVDADGFGLWIDASTVTSQSLPAKQQKAP